jgi:hypothetical protein
MSDTNERGIARRRLVLIGLDFTSDSNEALVSECIDAWGYAGLLEDVFLVDLGTKVAETDRLETSEQFKCARSATKEVVTLDRVLTSRIWSEITVVSIRLAPLSRIFSQRVLQEERLNQVVTASFPAGSPCKTGFFTLSWLNDELLTDSVFPQSFNTNLLHDRSIFAGEDLAISAFDDRSRHLSLAFTAIVAAGGFAGQSSSSLMPLVDRDGAMGLDRVVRPIRAIARAASGGWVFRDALQKAMSRDLFVMPSGVVNPIPDGGTPVVIENLVSQTVKMCGFNYVPHQSVTSKSERMGFFQALFHFLRNIWPYVGKSGRRVVAEKVAKLVAPLAETLQNVYGTDSIITIRGTSASDSGEFNGDVAKLLQYLVQNPNNLELEPSPDPQVWRKLAQVVTGSLDGSDLPKDISCLDRQGRIIFNDPAIVGPEPAKSVFQLSQSDLKVLGSDGSRKFREPDILFPETVEAFGDICSRAKQSAIFGSQGDVGVTSHPSIDSVADSGRARLIGGRYSDESRDSATKGNLSSIKATRDIRQIATDFEHWNVAARQGLQTSYLARLADILEKEALAAKQDVKLEELKRLVDEILQKSTRLSRSRLIIWTSGFGVVSLVGLLAASQFKWVSLAFLPFVIIWLVIWVFSSALALAVRVVKQAIADYREAHSKSSETGLQFMFNKTVQAMREYIRLRSLQTQFCAWSRILREVIHSPYGSRVREAELAAEITKLPHPRQFAIAQVEPDPDQLQNMLNKIRRQVLVRGYLDSVLRGTIGKWADRYRKFDLSTANHDPFADIRQTWGNAVSQRVDGSPVYYPLQDFFEELVHRDLREATAQDLQVEIERDFASSDVRDVFGVISGVDADHQALRDYTPDQYLFEFLGEEREIPQALRLNFAMELFGIETSEALSLRQENLDIPMSTRWDPQHKTLGHFGLRRNRLFVMLTHLITIGKQGRPRDLSGYGTPKVEESSTPKWSE